MPKVLVPRQTHHHQSPCQRYHEGHRRGPSSRRGFQSENGMRLCVPFIGWHAVRPTIIRVHVNTSGTTRSMQGQDNLDGGAHSWPIESLDPDLSHARTDCLWFKGASVRRTGCSPGTCCPGLPAVPRGPPSWPLVSTLEFRSENGKRLCVPFILGTQ